MSKTANKTHIVKSGETLSHIALEYYGRADLWKGLLHVNEWLLRLERVNKDTEVVIIKPGEEITILSLEIIKRLNDLPIMTGESSSLSDH